MCMLTGAVIMMYPGGCMTRRTPMPSNVSTGSCLKRLLVQSRACVSPCSARSAARSVAKDLGAMYHILPAPNTKML